MSVTFFEPSANTNTVFDFYRVRQNQFSCVSIKSSIAVKVSATTICFTIASVPSLTFAAAKTCTRDTRPAICFYKTAIPAITSRNINYGPSFQSNAPPNPFDLENYTENLVWISRAVPPVG